MNTYVKAFVAGLSATVVMTGFMLLAPLIGLPRMDVGRLLGSFAQNEVVGWIFHFVIGVVFAFIYIAFFNKWIPVEHTVLRGIIYGILVFVISEIILSIINIGGYLPWDEKESMAKMIFGNALACMLYGAVMGSFFKRVGVDGLEQSIRESNA